jgi:MFS family permease
LSATLVSPWFSIGVPYMFKEYFNFTTFEPEYILASSNFIESVGVILMSLVVAQIAFKFKIFQILKFGGILFFVLGIMNLLIIKSFDSQAITQNAFIYLFLIFSFMAGMINAVVNAPINATLFKYIDKKMIGKVSTLINSIGGIFYPITAIIAGYLIDYVNFYLPLYVCLVALLLITLVVTRSKQLRKLV